jgi:hypothetical protein
MGVWGVMPPDDNTKPPIFLISFPENNTAYSTKNISLTLNVSIGDSSTAPSRWIQETHYKADWQPNTIQVYEYDPGPTYPSLPKKTEFSTTLNLTGLQSMPRFPPERIPEGKHSVVVYVDEIGKYDRESTVPMHIDYYFFHINSSSTVYFTIDTTSPKAALFSPENKTYDTADVQLNFAVNETASQVKYSLDGQQNVAVSDNTTLTGLSEGEHSVTVYAQDVAGNVGVSETIFFTVKIPFPTTLVTATAVTIAAFAAGLLVYFKKRRQ